jgi:hypothetical protein
MRQAGDLLPFSLKTLVRQLHAVRTHRVSPEILAEIHTPVLLVTGDEDGLIHWSNSVRMEGVMPNARIVIIKGAGHGLIEQCHEVYNDMIMKFVRDCAQTQEGMIAQFRLCKYICLFKRTEHMIYNEARYNHHRTRYNQHNQFPIVALPRPQPLRLCIAFPQPHSIYNRTSIATH